METRRFILALSLSLVVFLVYVRFFAPVPPKNAPGAAPVSEHTTPVAKPVAQPKATPSLPVAQPITKAVGKTIEIDTDLVKAEVNTAGGVITHWELKHYREADTTPVGIIALYKRITGQAKPVVRKKVLGNVQLVPRYDPDEVDPSAMVDPLTLVPKNPGLASLAAVDYRADHDTIRLNAKDPTETLVLTYRGPGGIRIEKRLTFHNDDYRVDIAITTAGFDGYSLALGTDFGLADKVSHDASGRVGLITMMDGKTSMEKLPKIKNDLQYAGMVNWFGQEDKYFTATLIAEREGVVTARTTAAPKDIGDLLSSAIAVKGVGATTTDFTLYAGPKRVSILKAEGHGLDKMIDYGWFSILAKPMFWLLTKFYAITWNYGVAIILLTIVVRGIMFYPSLKSAVAMEEMKRIQPQLAAVREKYKKDPKKLNEEMMRLYKEHKVNPLGGCLPMALQLPFFIALYNVLSVSIELRQMPFISFWIKDLSVYDPYYILPILMGVSMIFTMKITSATIEPKQQQIMIIMNVVMIFLFAWLPAGLLLYITLSNVLSIGQQLYVRKVIGVKGGPAPAAS